ncbi:MAG: endonuclease MutS2 [Oligosphaeraceae bacterium]|nr:endonuclease MutS2 [Oligosphaeraceae bacterium]
MSDHSLAVLEYHRLLELISGYVQSPAGRQVIMRSRPAIALAEVQSRRDLYADLLALLDSQRSLPGLHAEDLGDILSRVAPGSAVLPGEDLLACRSQLDTVTEVAAFLQEPDSRRFVCLSRLGDALQPCPELRQALQRSLDHDGSVLDSASDTLRTLRRSSGNLERRIQRTLEDLLKNVELDEVLQEKFVTSRNGRFVIPVRREARNALTGLIHDHSNSGQTLFVEPSETLPLGNELVSLRLQERDEVRRILAELSARVRERLSHFRRNQEILAELDAAAAVARWARDFDCRLPAFGPVLQLQGARHPLLLAQFRQDGQGRVVVPLNLSLPKEIKALVITGSNTGGKTVALKTVGLLVLAAQSGFPVPVEEGSLFCLFDNILADIGDEQSLQANLSTFSAHIANIAAVIKQAARGRSLVLLDELGAGTDPLEGGGIACGILHALLQGRTMTIATTHLGMVKNYVHSHPEMINAAVRFNAETLQPEYALDIGRPGASHALHIARRMGLPPAVLETAEGMLSQEHLRLEDLLATMEAEQHQLSSHSAQAKATHAELMRERSALKQQQETLQRERKRILNDAFKQAEAIVSNARRDVENSLREIRESAQSAQHVAAVPPRSQVDAAVVKARKLIAEKERIYESGLKYTAAPVRPLPLAAVVPGQKVWVEKLAAHGRITAVPEHGHKVTVIVNAIPFVLNIADLQVSREADQPAVPPPVRVIKPRVSGQTSHEIKLLGLRVEEAIERLDAFLNASLLAQLEEVRVVHGFGTGKLRQGIHTWLRKQKQIRDFRLGKDFEDAGGAGVTIVRLK